MFKFEPVGRYVVNVCTNISCQLAGAWELLEHAEERLGVKAGSTTPDGLFTLDDVECIAACTEAPCLQVNYRYRYRVTGAGFDELVDDLAAGRLDAEVPPHGTLARVRQKVSAGALGRHRQPRPGRGGRPMSERSELQVTERAERAPVSDVPTAGGNGPIVVPGMVPTGPAIVTSRFDVRRRVHHRRLPAHGRLHGAAQGARAGMEPAQVHNEVKAADLLGRGGAGFPAGVKWGFCPPGVFPRYVVVNGDESEPGTFKDRMLMELDPHQLIEGIVLTGYAVGAAQAFLYVRGEMALAQERLAQALNDAYAAGYVGKQILGSEFSMDITLTWGAGAYIVGEETALIESLEGERGMPRLKPPFFPAAKGLYLQPTIVNNVETLSNIPWIVNNGGEAFKSIGAPTSTGMRMFAVSGHVNRPGVLRGPAGRHHVPPPVRGARVLRWHPQRPPAEGVHPRWSVGDVVLRGARRPAPRQAHRRQGRLDARLRRHRRDGRDHRHGAGLLAHRALLRQGELRQVHALPGGHDVARSASCAGSSTATVARAISTC